MFAIKRFAVLALISLTLALASSSGAFADFSLWNPVRWFSTSSDTADRNAARAEHEAQALEQKADEAQKQAEAARAKANMDEENATAETPVPLATDTSADTSDNKTSFWNPAQWHPGRWLGLDPRAQAAPPIPSSAATPLKAYRADEAMQMQAVETPVKSAAVTPARMAEKFAEIKNLTNFSKAVPKPPQASQQQTESNYAVLQTEKGSITIQLFPEEAPKTVANFTRLVEAGFYNQSGMKFHRVVPGFVVQTGDPSGTGFGGSKNSIPLEVKNKLSHDAQGWVGMARGADPDSATSQFYITLAPTKSLDGKYAIFGKVVSGLDVLGRISKDDKFYGIHFVSADEVTLDADPDKQHNWKKWF